MEGPTKSFGGGNVPQSQRGRFQNSVHHERLGGEGQVRYLQKTQKERDTGSKLSESTIDISLGNLFGWGVGEQMAYVGKPILDYVPNFFLLCLDFRILEMTFLDC